MSPTWTLLGPAALITAHWELLSPLGPHWVRICISSSCLGCGLHLVLKISLDCMAVNSPMNTESPREPQSPRHRSQGILLTAETGHQGQREEKRPGSPLNPLLWSRTASLRLLWRFHNVGVWSHSESPSNCNTMTSATRCPSSQTRKCPSDRSGRCRPVLVLTFLPSSWRK